MKDTNGPPDEVELCPMLGCDSVRFVWFFDSWCDRVQCADKTCPFEEANKRLYEQLWLGDA